MPSPIANFFIKAIVRSPLHRLLGHGFAVIAVTGSRTGKVYSTPINVAPSDGGYTVVTYRTRTWWRNLRGGRPALLTAAGRTVPVVGRIIETSNEVVNGLAEYFRQYPGYARYFEVKLDADGKPALADLEKAASQRVLVQLTPAPTQE
jgi:hypothetical protein